jgi:dipeptidyl aminopeptidase/acylaminoacyl peptidase
MIAKRVSGFMTFFSRQRPKAAILFCAVLLLASSLVLAQTPLLPGQLLDRYEFGELQWSPDGRRLAVVVEEPVLTEGQVSHIWMYDADDSQFRQLTFAGDKNNHPRWSADGNSLAFLSSRDEDKAQVYVLSMSGGESRAITKDDSGINGFAWSPEGESIAFLSADPAQEIENDVQDKDDEIVASELVRPTHLRIVNAESGEVSTVTAGPLRVSALSWRQDDNGFIIAATDNFSVELLTDRLFSIAKGGGELIEVAKPDGPISSLSVSPDDRFVAYIGSTEGGPIPHGLYMQPLDGESAVDLTGNTLDRMVVDYAWSDDGSIIVLVADGFGDRLIRVALDGSVSQIKHFSDMSVSAFAAVGKKIAYVASGSDIPPELHLLDIRGNEQISHLNADFPSLVAPKLIRYNAPDGIEIEAALFEPSHVERPKQGWSTVLLIHGGPSGRWSHEINDWAQLLAANGFAVLAPNIRGSVGYGLEFIRSNRYDWGGADYQDAIAGVDYLIQQGISDADRLAIAGWSYGGYMAAWAITQTDRFKAAIVGAAMTDLAVEYGTEMAEINAYDTWFLGTPYENLDDFQRMSPMTHVRNVTTPALILIGEEDRIDPVGQSRQFYRALKRYEIETELVIYPREPHTIAERAHKTDLMERLLQWIEIHLQ